MSAPASDHTAPVVLVHGAWHGAWCWAGLQAELDRRGVPSVAVDLPGHGASTAPLGSLADDTRHVDAVVSAVAAHHRQPAVVVGHSYGGAVLSGLATDGGHVGAAVFVAAFALATGSTVNDITRSAGDVSAMRAAIVVRDDGMSVLDPSAAVTAMYARCPPEVVAAAVRRLDAHPRASFAEPVEHSLLGHVPTTYVRCRHDRAVPVEQQDAMASTCDRTVTLDADHSPFLSAIGPLADVVAEAAGHTPASTAPGTLT